jgi:hypothetical protein
VLERLLEVLTRMDTRLQGIESTIAVPKREENSAQGHEDKPRNSSNNRVALHQREGHVSAAFANMIICQPQAARSLGSSFALSTHNATNSAKITAQRKIPKLGVLCLRLKFPISKSQRNKLHVRVVQGGVPRG